MSETPDNTLPGEELEPGIEPFSETFPSPRGGVTGGIPYPSPTDDLMAGASAIQAIADYLAQHGYGEAMYGVAMPPTGTDINTLTRTGNYAVQNGVNAPGTDWHIYRVSAYSYDAGGYVFQEATHMLSGNLVGQRWTRSMISGGWTPWTQSPAKQIAGAVDSAGTILSGVGFTVTKTGPGDFGVTFNVPYAYLPAVVVTPITTGGMTYAVVPGIFPNYFLCLFRNSAGGAADVGFSFVASS